MIPDPSPPFELYMSEQLRERIRTLGLRATQLGIGDSFRKSMQAILDALRLNPRRAGDPLRQLRGLHAIEYRLVRDQIAVTYTVHDRIPMVNLWRIVPVLNHPLDRPPSNGH